MATAVSIAKPLAVSMIRSGTERTAVNLAAAAFPQYAPFIYGGYVAFRTGWSGVQAYREYRELKGKMSRGRALRVEGERMALRAGTDTAAKQADPELRVQVRTYVGILLTRPEVTDMIEKALREKVTDETKQRFRMMMQHTASEFLLGAVEGGRGKVVDDAAHLFFR